MIEGTTPTGGRVTLRPLEAGEVPPTVTEDPWSDWGERLPIEETARVVHRLVVDLDGAPCGVVSWHRTHYGPNAGSLAWNIGIALVPQARGRGVGPVAQRLLAEHLLATTEVHRIEASCDVENVAEQRALERAGFRREGVLRGAQFRADGVHHDLVSYGRLRSDP